MERQVTVEEVRSFLSASDRQFVKGGIKVSRVRFKRDEEGNCTDILLDYEQTVSETGGKQRSGGFKMTKHRLTPQTRTKTPQRVSNPQTRARDNPQGKRQREERKP